MEQNELTVIIYYKKTLNSCYVDFRDGVSIRNWLRENTELGKELDSIELDDCYVKILEEAIK